MLLKEIQWESWEVLSLHSGVLVSAAPIFVKQSEMETRTAPRHCQLCSFCRMIGRILDLAQVHMMASLFFVFILIQVFATLGYWTFSQQTEVCSPCFPSSHRDWILSAYWSPWDSEAPACDSGTSLGWENTNSFLHSTCFQDSCWLPAAKTKGHSQALALHWSWNFQDYQVLT